MTILKTRKMMAWLGACAAAACFVASGCILQAPADDDGEAGSGGEAAGSASSTSAGAGVGGSGSAGNSRLFVVNNNSDLTSYDGVSALDGELAPATRLSLGAATSLFQPRALAITESGRLLVARQNGGIVGYDDGVAADGETSASLVVEGDGTGLDSPVAFAYQASSDVLYVGGPAMLGGLIVFADVSGATFNGEVAPARSFGPSDRVPYAATGTIAMSVDALALDESGSLFVSDTSGDNVNRSRVLFYDAPATLDGVAEPDAVFSSVSWQRIEDMTIDAAGTLYVVDSSDTVFVFDNADQLVGEVQPTRTITIGLNMVSLTGVTLSPAGLGYLADDSNHAIYTLDDMAVQDGSLEPARALEGFETRLRNPRKMFLLQP